MAMYRILYLKFILLFILLPAFGQNIDLREGLVLHMPLNGVTDDLSGFGNNGTLTNSAPAKGRFGEENGSFAFNGNGSISIPNSSSLNFRKAFSSSIWGNASTLIPQFQAIYSKGIESPGESYALFINSNGTLHSVLTITNPVNNRPQRIDENTSGRITAGNWHHIVQVYDGDTLRVYIDAEIAGEFSLPGLIATNTYDLELGIRTPSSWPLSGFLSDFRLYDRVLNENEIQALFDGDESPILDLDLGFSRLNLDDYLILDEGTQPVKVQLRNLGITPINEAFINWEINDIPQPKKSWTGELAFSDTDSVALGNYFFKPGIPYKLEATIESVNGTIDENSNNDTTAVNKIFVNPAEPHYALEFTANNQYVNIENTPDLNPLALTVEAWVNPQQFRQRSTIITRTTNSNLNSGFGLANDGGDNSINFYINNLNSIKVSANVPLNKWSHVAGTYDGSFLRIFINGELVDSFAYSLPLSKSSNPIRIGKSFQSSSSYQWFGQIDEVRIWNVARSQEQIKEWMVRNSNLASQPGLVAAWHFGEKIGDKIFELKGKHHGQAINNPELSLSTAPISDNRNLVDAGIVGISIAEDSLSLGSKEINVALHNFGMTTFRNLQINWSVNNLAQKTEGWQGNLVPGQTDTVNLGTFTFESRISSKIDAWSSLPNGSIDLKTSNDTSYIENILSPLVGEYSIGGSGSDFTTIQEAVDRLQEVGIVGDVTFNLNNGVYREQISISEFPGSSCENKVVFQATSGNRNEVKISWNSGSGANNYVVQLNGADGVELRNLTINEEGGSTNRVIDIRNGASCNIIENCHLISPITGRTGNAFSVIYSPDQSITNNNNVVKNNLIENGSMGIGFYNGDNNIYIEGNTFLNQSVHGIRLESNLGAKIIGNNVSADRPAEDFSGILINQNSGDIFIEKNIISLNRGYGIYLSETSPHIQIVNNAVSIGGQSLGYGIYLDESPNVNILNNTINISSSDTIEGRALFIHSGNDLQLKALNNIFANNGGGYAVYSNVVNPFEVSDYNNFYSSGNILAFSAEDIVDLNTWQTSTGSDGNSVSVDPIFSVEDEGFSVFQQVLDNKGIPIDGVSEDIDGDPRSLVTPDIGADEFTLVPNDMGVTQILYPKSGCELSATDSIVVEISNFGSTPQSGFEIAYQINGLEEIEETIPDTTIQPGQKFIYTFKEKVNLSMAQQYVLKAFTRLQEDQNTGNDAVNDYTFRKYLPVEAVQDMLPVNESVGLDVPLIFSWSPSENVDSYDFYLWPLNTNRPANPTSSDIKTIRYIHYGNLNYGTTYQWQVVAKNICSEEPSSNQTFTLRELPDLVINPTDIDLPSGNLLSGQTTSISFEVKNEGPGSTGSTEWVDAVYLSTDPELDLGVDVYLAGKNNVKALAPDESYIQEVTFTLPKHQSDEYFIFIVGDKFGKVKETNKENNTAFPDPPLTVSLAPYANLKVGKITKPFGLFTFSGMEFEMEWERINSSQDASTEVKDWIDRVYLSQQPILDKSNAYVLGEKRYGTNPLGPQKNEFISDKFTLPNGIFGTFYVFVETDVKNEVFEYQSDTDNISKPSDSIKVTLRPPPNLFAERVNSPSSVSNKQVINIEFEVSNLGETDSLAKNWTDNLYLTKEDTLIINKAIKLGEFPRMGILKRDSSYTRSVEIEIPDGIDGNYHMFLMTDANYGVFEYDKEGDNVKGAETLLQITSPDLNVSEIDFKTESLSGQPLTFNWTLTNSGPGDLIEGQWTDRILLSTQADQPSENSIELGRQSNRTPFMPPGGTETFQRQLKVPNGLEGNYYLFVETDFNNNTYEANEDNNISDGKPLLITLAPIPDLSLKEVDVNAEVQAGNPVTISFAVENIGEADIPIGTWTDQIYLSPLPFWNSQSSKLLRSIPRTQPLLKGSNYEVTTSLNLPAGLSQGNYYFFVLTNQGQSIYEPDAAKQNNIGRSREVFVLQYPPVDLEVIDFKVTASDLKSGASFDVSFTVKNNSPTPTALSSWNDAIYLSKNNTWESNSDILVSNIPHSGIIQPNASYMVNRRVSFPNGVSGSFNVVAVADHDQENLDLNPENNYQLYAVQGNPGEPEEVISFDVQATPPPDLMITGFDAPATAIAGQPNTVSWIVQNKGTGQTIPDRWSDRLGLSESPDYEGNIIPIGESSRRTPLDIGESYRDTIEFTIPSQVSGNFFLVLKTDAGNQVYEHLNENNNVMSTSIIVDKAPLSDLEVSQINTPETTIAGDSVSISWTTKNIGSNPASGFMTESLFLSPDSIWDPTDIVFHTVRQRINLPPLSDTSNMINKQLTGVSMGDYYVFVHTDIRNNLPESNEANNLVRGDSPIRISVEQLPLDISTPSRLYNATPKYYRLEIPDSLAGESLVLRMNSKDSGARNEAYLKFGSVPNRVVYDMAQDNPFLPDQTLVVPELQVGTYYLMLLGTGSNPEIAQQDIELLAEVLEFEIHLVDAKEGGNTGIITLKLEGAQFEPDMEFQLTHPELGTVKAHRLEYIDPTTLFVSVDLAGKPLGIYTAEIQKTNGSKAVRENAFEVVPGIVQGLTMVIAEGLGGGGRQGKGFSCCDSGVGTDQLLTLEVDHPESTRPNRIVVMTVEASNTGNVDIPVPSKFILSVGGAPLAFKVDELDKDNRELLLEFKEKNGPEHVLRPGAKVSLVLYSKSIAPLQFQLVD
ncbi:LamG-like jellyroll fold domain-containing protein [Cyclobacterium plantarum]|uniref:LamG-like jellyroll fold domain-containing protein n=1 Tax=Cyclobacterium plantarum TaxID=2716263 RepID=UPI003F70CE6A